MLMLLSTETRHCGAVESPVVEEVVRGDPVPFSLSSCEENKFFYRQAAIFTEDQSLLPPHTQGASGRNGLARV